jgi:sensor c-di-GMP phosphodiesterase-like protein
VTLALAAVPIVAGMYFTRALALERTEAELAQVVARVATSVREILWDAEGVLADVHYLARRYGCGAELIGAFNRNANAHHWMRGMAYVTAEHRLACTSFGKIDPPVAVPAIGRALQPSGATTLRFTAPMSTPFLPGMSMIAGHHLAHGAHAGDWILVLVPPQELLGGLQLKDLRQQGWLEVRVAGQPMAHLGEPLEDRADALTLRRDVGLFDASVTAAVDPVGALAAWRRDAILYGAVAAIAALALAGGAAYLAWHRSSLVGEIQDALRNDELEVYYQPVIELASERCVGAEALIRWRHPDRGLIPPDLFVGLAEDTGDIVPMTRFLMARVGEELGERLRADPAFHIAINLAPIHFQSRDVIEDAKHAADAAGIPPARILFEITERGLVDEAGCRAVIEGLKALGHEVAVDDFGTGYSSLSYVEKFHLDYLKIDKAFVRAIGTGAATAGLASVIVQMAKTLGLKVIAEGVETEAQARFLAEHGVQTAQGWYYAKPMPAPRFLAFVDAFNAGRTAGGRSRAERPEPA